MSGMRERMKWREGPLQPTHTPAGPPPLISWNQLVHLLLFSQTTLPSCQIRGLHFAIHHLSHALSVLFYSAFHFCPPLLSFPSYVESAELKKKCSRRAVQHIHLSKCSSVKCSVNIKPRSIVLLCQLILCGRYQRFL